MRVWIVALALSIGLAGAARGEDPAPPPGDTELRWVDPWDQGESYRSLRAGEGFRTRIIGRDVAIEPRDRRSTSAFDVGAAAQFPGPEFADFLPFASFYFWRRPDEHRFLRATVGGVYNDIVGAHSIANSPFEVVGAIENNTVPFASATWVDGESNKPEELSKGWVRGAVGLGYRRQLEPGWSFLRFADGVDPQKPDNMFSFSLAAEPKYLYFRWRNSVDNFVVPHDTFELDGRAQLRWDALERNLLELAHSGYALGFDGVYGWRANWEDWGIDRIERADRGRYPASFQTYAVVASGIPGLDNERHRLIESVHAGWGWHLDRFSYPRVGGGPGGQEFMSLARPLLPGAAISEFEPKHYAIASEEYRYEILFFTYLSVRGGVAWLDRERLGAGAIVHSENGFLNFVGAGITTGFAFHTQLQVDYNYNFDVIRERDRGASELVVHISKSF